MPHFEAILNKDGGNFEHRYSNKLYSYKKTECTGAEEWWHWQWFGGTLQHRLDQVTG